MGESTGWTLTCPPSFHFELNGARIQIRSVNLSQDWAQVRSDLLALTA
jgi:hypothetical protein